MNELFQKKLAQAYSEDSKPFVYTKSATEETVSAIIKGLTVANITVRPLSCDQCNELREYINPGLSSATEETVNANTEGLTVANIAVRPPSGGQCNEFIEKIVSPVLSSVTQHSLVAIPSLTSAQASTVTVGNDNTAVFTHESSFPISEAEVSN